MSDENKDLGDKAEEAFDKAKETAKDAADEVKDAIDDTKETIKNDADNGKMVAIIAHLTFIGWIVAIIMNNNNKTALGSYYIRQTLGIFILAFLLGLIPVIGCFAAIIAVVLLVMSFINAINEKMVPTPVVGQYFQDWFKSL
ncbi:YtxH domain-containing protein [Maribacter sp. 2210JD10-5]|uniref:YtxH domain-containing protein n=1 Tax=Maribacter sp. 2210JD10-5 TaxID=3386272 RepID=UPI0039BD0538